MFLLDGGTYRRGGQTQHCSVDCSLLESESSKSRGLLRIDLLYHRSRLGLDLAGHWAGCTTRMMQWIYYPDLLRIFCPSLELNFPAWATDRGLKQSQRHCRLLRHADRQATTTNSPASVVLSTQLTPRLQLQTAAIAHCSRRPKFGLTPPGDYGERIQTLVRGSDLRARVRPLKG